MKPPSTDGLKLIEEATGREITRGCFVRHQSGHEVHVGHIYRDWDDPNTLGVVISGLPNAGAHNVTPSVIGCRVEIES